MLMRVPSKLDRRVLRQDRDAALPLLIVGVEGALHHLLVLPEGARELEHLIHQGGLAVIDVGHDRQVADLLGLLG